ncbi:hypothetical protein BD779DRAFT_1467326 [Infundibulicybe gibba]|nr:hypothetical protein BD779DRAFT_1467326 [Infundibulicybe gibba]
MLVSSASAALNRGSACLNCRQKKMKCDGAQPVCGQCSKSNTSTSCIYDGRRKKSRTERLTETVYNLESIIQELEGGPSAPADVTTTSRAAIITPQSMMLPSESIPPAIPDFGYSAVMGPQTEVPSSSTSVIGMDNLYDRHGLGSVDASVDAVEARSFLNSVNTAMSHRHEFYFEKRAGHHPAITDALSLLGCYYARSYQYTHLEPTLLTRTQNGITSALAAPDQLIDAVQASTLLAVYFYLNNRITEGYYYAFPSARLAADLGLHQIPPPPDRHCPGSALVRERISVFWQVYMVDRCCHRASGEHILTPPWGTLPTNEHSLAGALGPDNPIVPYGDRLSLQEIKSHAAVLFEWSARLTSASARDEDYFASIASVTAAVRNLSATVPPFRGYEPLRGQVSYDDMELFTIHMFTQTSQLHLCMCGVFPIQEILRTVSFITQCIRQLSIADYEFLDRVVSIKIIVLTSGGQYCWLTAARLCICTLRTDMQGDLSGRAPVGGLTEVLKGEVATLASAVETLATYSPLSGEDVTGADMR